MLTAGMFTGALVYGGIGIVLAAVLRSELAGMFLAIMISSIDLVLQNPLISPDAEKQRASYEKIQTLYEELVPSIQVISQSYDTVVYQADLKNYIAHPYQTTRYRTLEKDR